MAQNSVSVREAVISDCEAIAALCREDLGYACTPDLLQKRMVAVDKSRERVYVAIQGETVIGFVHAARYETLYFEPLVNLLGLAVSEKYRRSGAGCALLSAVESWAREIGAAGIRANSGASRQDAHAFYRTLEFADEKPQIRFIKWL
ncbi:MAG: GNAT family N-acetyltransferase [Candidatus Fimenecus sp.]